MTSFALRLYLVTDPQMSAARGLVPTVEAAVAGGVSIVQLRDPDADGAALYESARRLLPFLRSVGVPLIVNDRLDVALAAGADGVHVGQRDLPAEAARRVGGPDLIVGLSVSTAAEVDAANALPAGTVDYLGIGPVFATATKPEAAAPLGVAAVAELAARTHIPAVAIGGVSIANAADILTTGVDGLCVVSAICAAADPRAAAAELAAL